MYDSLAFFFNSVADREYLQKLFFLISDCFCITIYLVLYLWKIVKFQNLRISVMKFFFTCPAKHSCHCWPSNSIRDCCRMMPGALNWIALDSYQTPQPSCLMAFIWAKWYLPSFWPQLFAQGSNLANSFCIYSTSSVYIHSIFC